MIPESVPYSQVICCKRSECDNGFDWVQIYLQLMHLVQNAINKLVIQTSCQKISILFYYHHDLIIESCRVHVIYGVHKNHFSHVLNNKAFWLEMLIFIHMQIILMYCPSVLSILIPVLLKMKHQVSSAFVNDSKECVKFSGVVLLFINLSYINGCCLFII